MHEPNGRKHRLRSTLLAAAAVALLGAGSVARAADPLVDPRVARGSLAGKRVLVSPYWLDSFGTANSSWIARLLQPYGVKVDVVNPNGSSSRQLDALQTAIASQNYDVIVWQPVDAATAPPTIRKIQQARIGQVLQFAPGGMGGLNYSTASIDWTKVFVQPGKDAANFIKAHPKLGPPRIAWLGPVPQSRICEDRFKGLVDGVRSVSPNARVVLNQGATSQEAARSKMSDFLTGGASFNIFAACGGIFALGGISAINAAGLGGATNKVPQHVYMISLEASPPELRYLWSKDSALMRSGLFGAKTAAVADVRMILNLLTGKVAYNQAAAAPVTVTWLTPDCRKDRPAAVEQFLGVKGFSIPECSPK